MKIKLGLKYKDAVSGFIGIAIMHTAHMSGCSQATLQSKVDEKMDNKNFTIDDIRLEAIDESTGLPGITPVHPTHQFGMRGKDIVTGFEGIVYGHTIDISGTSQLLLLPKIDKQGKRLDGEWFDIQRIQFRKNFNQLTLNNEQAPGCDRTAPASYKA